MLTTQRFNYLLTIEYRGESFHGWQRQQGVITVQGILEKALKQVSGEPVVIEGAGRTDAGVHATGQAATVTFQRPMEIRRLIWGTNFYLKQHPVRLTSARNVSTDFHARFSALKRFYRYRLLNRPVFSPLREAVVYWIPQKLDLVPMQMAASYFIGHHNFSAFRSRFCQADSAYRTMDTADIAAVGDETHFTFSSRAFLHNQVRLMVGSLIQVGLKKKEPSWIQSVLKNGSRGDAGPKVPPTGLCLEKVCYPTDKPSQENAP